jgi:hypothetical protein
MITMIQLAAATLLVLLSQQAAFAEMVTFDFDDVQSLSKKGPKAGDIEVYMENLFGAGITVSSNTGFGKSGSNGFLKAGKGRGAGFTIDFGDNPIDSFSVDWLLRKGGKRFAILADGEVVTQQILSKAQSKAGLYGSQGAYFFDEPVHQLQFIGLKKKSYAIDNLVINIPLGGDGDPQGSEQNDTTAQDGLPGSNPPWGGDLEQASVPEISSLLMLTLGVLGGWLSRRIRAA